ncbi:cobyric acid synthase [Corynebacterium sp. ES2794-CONJ1]|uniref:cobyric acid synthase n=1 Tax=Corynebacterium sp. ES2794-CONJ1 TaxID=2980553 RepID=UPI0021D9D720|nr:cobyric acid synthase [Corynebacterium sp. ES2794-CONJ1]MCU9518567.1 cobyric acid synthase [Corynebacterium sp. ES2794-CONJ1]
MVSFLVAGCTSDAGKSVVVAGLCRAFYRRGVAVAPFKAQNMSNNSDVTPDGGEIGRAQTFQALAAGLEPETKFNPVLLKPGSDRTSQLVVRGQAMGVVSAHDYFHHRSHIRDVAVTALKELEQEFDLVICEGAGSPAEINLRHTDIANFGLAEKANLPVYLVGDIDRGGVLAHFYGTHQIVSPADRARIQGFVVNKFRGTQSLLEPGLAELERLTGVATKAVLPFIEGLWIDAEDSLQSQPGATIGPHQQALGSQRINVAAIRLPRISNATDIEALAAEPGINASFSVDPDYIAEADLVVIPGSKSTLSDLLWLHDTHIAAALEHRRINNLPTLGICGGFQMMCKTIVDTVESSDQTSAQGLNFFDADIEFADTKTLIRHDHGAYEVHYGQLVRAHDDPWISGEGLRRGNFFGTHRHGQMENNNFRREFLGDIAGALGKNDFVISPTTDFAAERLTQLDMIADHIEDHWDLDQLLQEIS